MDEEPVFADALATDRFIKIYVGKGQPFLVQQLLLESLSDYFVRALQRDKFSEGIHGELHVEGDDRRTWQALLHWLFKGVLPANVQKDPDRLIDIWVVGDKYGVEALQNQAMYALLKRVDVAPDDIVNSRLLPLATIKDGIHRTAPGSVMRTLLAEEIVRAMYWDRSAKYEDFLSWDGVGLASDLLRACDRRGDFGAMPFLHRFVPGENLWEGFMLVGGGLSRDRSVFQPRKRRRSMSSLSDA
ncbi:hypothetical protein KC340_g12459 [Hortaea werneckii]|nr:hypothetical protein KC342_g9016 [Hortaea werneckii]KAI7098268.1 hypothetical protein KC339_g9071 [Hortaea werneckii]KAI7221427.1 hypothetical protein KC365_g11697 [Hortaea werneckii]KAI7303522.1 hypothetical protein KC340_g12459 [Hortaea werneckii]KAI7372596.1 hypothetical protein KC328_g17148 [Hortaea werneckii]